jgi:hypothetical protein
MAATCIHLLTSIQASRYRSLTVDGWIGLGLTAGAEKGLGAHPPARLAKTQVAEGAALVLATGESLLASLQTQVPSQGISHALLDRAADLLTLVLLTRL